MEPAQKLVCELAEEAQQLEDARMFPARVLDRLEQTVGFDSAMCLPLQGPRRPLASKNKEPYVRFLHRYASEPRRFEEDLVRGRAAARAGRGAYIDTQVFSANERRELPFFAEIIRPQNIRSQLVTLISFRGEMLAAMHLCRHGLSRPFEDAQLDTLRTLSPFLGLAHAAFRSPNQDQALEALGPREREVARYAAQGLHNREIATLLGSSVHTVRNQLHRIFQKVGVSTRAELAAWLHGGRERAGVSASAGPSSSR